MKLVRYGAPGAELPGILDRNSEVRDLSSVVRDIAGDALLPGSLARLSALNPEDLPRIDGTPRLGPCVGAVGKYICVGLNYATHAAESGMAVPPEPIIFMKATSAIVGPDDDVEIPRNGYKTDWEVELGVVIGKPAKYVLEENALEHVAGYCVANDLSERHFQLERHGQWVKGKSHDTFGPIGPWLVTADEVPDPQNLALSLDLNGKCMQTGNTSDMVYTVRYLVAYLSQFMTLQPGDFIATGTPPGVGLGQKPEPFYLKPGDLMSLRIEGLGEQNQRVIPARAL